LFVFLLLFLVLFFWVRVGGKAREVGGGAHTFLTERWYEETTVWLEKPKFQRPLNSPIIAWSLALQSHTYQERKINMYYGKINAFEKQLRGLVCVLDSIPLTRSIVEGSVSFQTSPRCQIYRAVFVCCCCCCLFVCVFFISFYSPRPRTACCWGTPRSFRPWPRCRWR
jgi:hypothetical protein